MRRIILAAFAALALSAQPIQTLAQGGYLECSACQLVLGLVESSAGDGQDVTVDASRQCSLLPAGDRAECERFYAAMGPKFLKALKERRAKGASLEDVCRAMAYCR